MSYIQIEIGGKLRGLKFNQYANVIFYENVDLKSYAASSQYAVVYAGLKGNCYVKREEPDFTFEQVCDWVDELPEESLLKAMNAFTETNSFKKLIEASEKIKEEELTKKKQENTELKI